MSRENAGFPPDSTAGFTAVDKLENETPPKKIN